MHDEMMELFDMAFTKEELIETIIGNSQVLNCVIISGENAEKLDKARLALEEREAERRFQERCKFKEACKMELMGVLNRYGYYLKGEDYYDDRYGDVLADFKLMDSVTNREVDSYKLLRPGLPD